MTDRRGSVVALAPGTLLVGLLGVTLVLPVALLFVELARGSQPVLQTIDGSINAVVRSVVFAALGSALALPLALAVAIPLSRTGPAARLAGIALSGMPLVLNVLVVILAWMVMLEPEGLAPTVWSRLGLPGRGPELMFTGPAALLASVYVVTPVMALLLLQSLRGIDPRTREAATLLGARRLTRLFWVDLGAVAPTLLTAFVAGYLICLNLYLIPEYLAGPRLTMLGLLVQQDVVKSFDLQAAATRSALLLVMAVVPVTAVFAIERRLRPR